MDSLNKYFQPGQFEAGIRKMAKSVEGEGQEERINNMLKIELIECNESERSVTFEFPVADWELNSNNIMHGGISASIMDLALGTPANYIALEMGALFAPTISMTINYLLPILLNDKLVVTTKIVSSGTSIITVTGEARLKSSGAVAVTGSAMYKVLMPKVK
jgi:uncharacterized protein (TIGR00369 family)